MPHYFYVHDAEQFFGLIGPALTASWRQRSFAPLQTLEAAYLEKTIAGVDFHRDLWRFVVGEVLLYAAVEVPVIATAPEALKLLTRANELIHQTHFGSRDIQLGAFYRPDQAGLNNPEDVHRLMAQLAAVDGSDWNSTALLALTDGNVEEADEELAFVRQCFGDLRDLYQRAADRRQIFICEWL